MRKALKSRLEKLWEIIGDAQAELSAIATEHATYCDERSEKWHESDAGERAEMDSGELEDAQANMEEIVACIDRIIH